ncbi:hypothetical protein FRC11_009411, partial [Ceratobasidium sp. 423]
MSSLPQTMKALIVQEGKKVELEEIPVLVLDPNEVLIRVHSVARNPTDWKHTNFVSLVKLGPDSISRVKVGDMVDAFLHGGNYKDRGAFAQYTGDDSDP